MIAICERTSIEITLENATNYAVYALLRLFSIIDMWEIDRLTWVNNRPIMIELIYLYSWSTIKNDHLAKWSIFVWCILSLIQPLSPLDPRRSLNMLYIYTVTFNCPKSIFGLGGKSIENQTERRQFHLFIDKRQHFKYIRYACAEEIPQS